MCERFTTSKIMEFSDLEQLSTKGFRGEALASINNVASLTVISRTKSTPYAWQARYENGYLIQGSLKRSAREVGTTIEVSTIPRKYRIADKYKVNDLFHSEPLKLERCKSGTYLTTSKVEKTIKAYSIHYADKRFRFCPFSCFRWVSQNADSTRQRIDHLFGNGFASIKIHVSRPALALEADGWISDSERWGTRLNLVLLINNCQVQHQELKRGIKQVCHQSDADSRYPFIYLSLGVDPKNVDSLVHPRKLQVVLWNQEQIIAEICAEVRRQLPNSRCASPDQLRPTQELTTHVSSAGDGTIETILEELKGLPTIRHGSTSIDSLIESVKKDRKVRLRHLLSSFHRLAHTDPSRHVYEIHSASQVYVVRGDVLLAEALYQIGLATFKNFGSLITAPAPDLRVLIEMAFEQVETLKAGGIEPSAPFLDTPRATAQALIEKRETLSQQFNIQITPDGKVLTMPLLAYGHLPSPGRLPAFFMRLAHCICLENQSECLEAVLRELALLYVPSQKTEASGSATRPGRISQCSCCSSSSEVLLRYVLKHIKEGNLVCTQRMALSVEERENHSDP